MAGSPLPPLGLGVAGRAPSRGQRRRERARADTRTHGGAHDDGPAARRPGGARRAGRVKGSLQADGKQPKEATDRKRKWPRAPPGAHYRVCAAPASSALPTGKTSLPAREARLTDLASLTSARRHQGPGRRRNPHPTRAQDAGRFPRPSLVRPLAPSSGHTPGGEGGYARQEPRAPGTMGTPGSHTPDRAAQKVKYNKMFNEQIRLSKYETATEEEGQGRGTRGENNYVKKPGRTRGQGLELVELGGEGGQRAGQQNSKFGHKI